MMIRDLIQELKNLYKKHGNLEVYYVSQYDWASPIISSFKDTDPGWDGSPIESAIYLE